MPITLTAKTEVSFDEEQRVWRGSVTPTLTQSHPGYFVCSGAQCDRGILHESELTDPQPDGTSMRCPGCNLPVDGREDDAIEMQTLEYEAGSVCEVNSAIETNLLVIQRRCEEEGENLRQAEEDRRNKTVTITRVGEEGGDANPEPEAG